MSKKPLSQRLRAYHLFQRHGSRAATRKVPFSKNVISPLACIGLFWLVDVAVLVLSEAVLVIVIDVSMNLCAGLRDTIEFHRHSGQHRDDPIVMSRKTEQRSRSRAGKRRVVRGQMFART